MSDCNPSINIHMGFVWTRPRKMLSARNICGQLLNISGGSAVVWAAMLLDSVYLMIVLYGHVRIQPGTVLKDQLYHMVFPYDVSIFQDDNALVHMATQCHMAHGCLSVHHFVSGKTMINIGWIYRLYKIWT